MIRFIVDNWPTIIALLVLAGLVAAAVVVLVRNRRKGKRGCNGDCENCGKCK